MKVASLTVWQCTQSMRSPPAAFFASHGNSIAGCGGRCFGGEGDLS
ncbi:MAG: hypothetical protein WAT39_07730 [Planctomycetota bacterium]